MLPNDDNIVRMHRNKPQLKAIAVDANIEVCLWGRRTGKSVRIAEWLKKRSEQMPRCNLVFLSTSYKHLRKKILPEIYLAWEGMGWIRNVHYWVNQHPPKELGIPLPIRPADKEDSIFTVWGSVIKLASMDKNAPSAGDASDGLAVDECRLIDGNQMQTDILPSISGTNPKWRGLSCYCSKLFVTDKPRTAKGKWILDYRKQQDESKVKVILNIEIKRNQMLQELLGKVSKKRKVEIDEKLLEYDKVLNMLRKNLTFVSEASTMDNIHVLGVDQIKGMKRTMTSRNFKISVMNKDGMEVPNNFYVDWDEDIHGYYAFTKKFLDEGIGKYRYEWFGDINPNLPLEMVIDTNLGGNCCTIRQIQGDEAKTVLCMWNIAPLDHTDLAVEICKYLAPHQRKEVLFIYNHTFTAGKKYNKPYIALEWAGSWRGQGWTVNEHYLGQAWEHEKLFYALKKAFTGQLKYKYSHNRHTCQKLYDCAKQTETVQSESKGLKKNKNSEKDSNIPYEDATHLPESFDQFIQYDCRDLTIMTPDEEELLRQLSHIAI